ncbi:MAG: hypothetical protein R3Y53_08935 [Bacillota bacterium]
MKKKAISASEINRFAYCPYQWYYERIYGKKELLRLRRERLDALGVKPSGNNRLKEGIRYHDKHYVRMQRQDFLQKVLFFIVVIGIMVSFFYLKIHPEFFTQ